MLNSWNISVKQIFLSYLSAIYQILIINSRICINYIYTHIKFGLAEEGVFG